MFSVCTGKALREDAPGWGYEHFFVCLFLFFEHNPKVITHRGCFVCVIYLHVSKFCRTLVSLEVFTNKMQCYVLWESCINFIFLKVDFCKINDGKQKFRAVITVFCKFSELLCLQGGGLKTTALILSADSLTKKMLGLSNMRTADIMLVAYQ